LQTEGNYSPDRISIRPARFTEAARIAELWTRSIREVSSHAYEDTPELMDFWTANKTPETIRRLIGGLGTTMVVAELDGQLAGLAIMTNEGEITSCYVAPEAVRHGVGRRLMEHLEAEARDCGHDSVRLNSSLNAIGFYERLGYRPVGGQRLFLDKIPCVPMEKTLGPPNPSEAPKGT
jgi:ribosomal protein S18 acetylase RimI-like enzyme